MTSLLASPAIQSLPLWWPLVLASLLFAIGIYGVLVRRNTVLMLMGVELMLNAVNINLVAFDAHFRDVLHGGQTFALFVIVIAAAEIGLALAIVLMVFRSHGHIDAGLLRSLADRDEPDVSTSGDAIGEPLTERSGGSTR